jgi:hypothetical protein
MDEQKVQQGIERQQVQKEVKRRTQTSRQRIQERTREYGTLTNALLNGSLTKWLFVLIMLSGTILTFNSLVNDHWLQITQDNGQDIYTFNEDSYELDYTIYSVIGEKVISNFEGVTNLLNIGTKTYETITYGIDALYELLYRESGLFADVRDGYLRFIDRWFGFFERFRRD